MEQHKPPHPGGFIKRTYIVTFDLTISGLANELGVAASTLNKLINAKSSVSSEMALRLSYVLGRSAESWLAMQSQYDLWQARKKINAQQFTRISFEAA